MRVRGPGGRLAAAIQSDPRFSQAQRDAMLAITRSDVQAEILGLDARLRPVIQAALGPKRQRASFALLRNGEPKPVTGRLREEW